MNADFPRIMTLMRKERKISQKQAAADLGISQALLSHYEKGIRECGLEFLVRAADYYNVSCDYLLGRSPSPDGKTACESCSTQSTALASSSAGIVLELCEENEIGENVSEYMNACVYKLLRMIYNSNPENDQNAFRVSAEESEYLSDCIVSRECAQIKKKCSESAVKITISELPQRFPESHSLLSLIKLTEDKIAVI